LPYIPPNGKWLLRNETVLVPGILETEVYLAKRSDVFGEYAYDVQTRRIDVETTDSDITTNWHTAILGNGLSTTFDVETEFVTAGAGVYAYDLFSGSIVEAYQYLLSTPNTQSVRFVFDPAPGTSQIQIFIYGV
jgi:hypothetical protein